MSILSEQEIQPIDLAIGVIWHKGETNKALAKRDYSINCKTSLSPIIVFKGYFIWWCENHHQPLTRCEVAKAQDTHTAREIFEKIPNMAGQCYLHMCGFITDECGRHFASAKCQYYQQIKGEYGI